MRIIFLGTPDFAVASLQALVENNFEVVAVVTAPDRPAGRGLQMQESAVKKYALQKQIPVLQPLKLKDPTFIDTLKAFKPDIQVVVAFRMLPEQVWNLPPMGTINVHASLLPAYRGAAPINWAIIHGEHTTGVTTFKLQHAIDTGDILLQSTVAISETETAGSLHDKLMHCGAVLLVQTLHSLQKGILQPKAQITNNQAPHAPKIHTETCKIDWNRPCRDVYNHIRGLSPYPAAFTQWHGKLLKILQAKPIIADHHHTPGEVECDYKKSLAFYTQDGYLLIEELQMEGKKRMKTEDFLKGYRPPKTVL